MTSHPPIRHVAVWLKPASPEAAEAGRELVQWLQARGIEVEADEVAAEQLGCQAAPRSESARRVDLIIVLGGDGTLLGAARDAGENDVPFLGINLGTLGFLAEVAPEEQADVLAKVLRGEFATVTRNRLRVIARRGSEVLLEDLALNDVVITRNDLSRLLDLETVADGTEVTTYYGDGLIVSTPTGSTAYTLSAGGPILMPGSGVYVLTPICPHALTQRPLVLSEQARLAVRIHPRGGTAQLTVDGQVGVVLERDDVVTVESSGHPVRMVASPLRSRFDVLRTKLGWGGA